MKRCPICEEDMNGVASVAVHFEGGSSEHRKEDVCLSHFDGDGLEVMEYLKKVREEEGVPET